MAANSSKLVNLSREARAELRGIEELNAKAAGQHRDAEIVADTIQRVERAKTPAGRRTAVVAGLAKLSSGQARHELLLAASHVEVDAVLMRVDGLKTVAAKRRCLTQALDALRGDEVPDDLQRAQIEMLESALGDLDAD